MLRYLFDRLFHPDRPRTKCANCGEDVVILSTAPRVKNKTFCCPTCWEEWEERQINRKKR
jgi:formylmethanofuran dehydrogenase subunit E